VKAVERYLKPLAQLAATVLSAALVLLTDNENLSRIDWLNIIMTGLGAAMVLGAGNLPDGVWKYTKAIVSALIAALVIVHTVWSTQADLETRHWIEMGLAALATLGVYTVKGPKVVPVPIPERRGKHAAPEV
jgi:drug/metabolite transporter (DMT)-like permease